MPFHQYWIEKNPLLIVELFILRTFENFLQNFTWPVLLKPCLKRKNQLSCWLKNKARRLFDKHKRSLYQSFIRHIFTFSSHTEYVKRESIVIAWVKKKKFSPFDKCLCLLCLRRQNKLKKNFRLSVYLSVCLDVWMYVRTWTFHVDTITFEGVSGSKQNLMYEM